MNLRQIEIFGRVMTLGSLGEAARSLGLSQPAASRILRHAEDQLGFPLFERVRGRLVPTAEARGLYATTRRLHDALATLDAVADALRGGHDGHLRLVVTPALGMGVLPKAVGAFRRLHPEVTLDLVIRPSGAMTQALRGGAFDFGLGLGSSETPGLEREVLGEARMVCLCGRGSPLAALDTVRLEHLVGQGFIGVAGDGPLSLLFREATARAGVVVRPQVTVETLHLARTLVENGGGVTLVDPYTAAAADPARTVIRPLEPPLRCAVTLLRLEEHPLSLQARRFVTLFRDRLGNRLEDTP